jgi:iron complex transport system substrate-binding protein
MRLPSFTIIRRMRANLSLPAILCLAVVPALVGCGSRGGQDAGQDSREPKSGAQRLVTDQLSRKVTMGARPTRIVSMAPSITEMLFALGAWPRVVGVTQFDEFPEDVGTRASIGDMLNPNLEVILGLKPDLVVATVNGNYQSSIDRLQSFGIPVFILGAGRVDEIYQSFRHLGDAIGESAEAERQIDRMRGRIEGLTRRLSGRPPVPVLYLTWVDPILVPGRDAFETEALRLAGAESLTRTLTTLRYPRFSLEQVLRLAPGHILTVKHNARGIEALLGSPRWASVPAVQKKQVYLVSDLIQHPSQRIAEGIEEVARKLHPDAF